MIKKTKIGIIGPGKHFEGKIFPVLKKHKLFSIEAVLREKQKKYKNFQLIQEKQFFKKDLDFVYISTPNQFHEKYIIKSLKAGFHVICEKPFVVRQSNLLRILNLAKKNKKLIFECFMYKYHPVFHDLKKIIQTNKFGKLKYLISNFKFPFLNKNNNLYKKKNGNGFWFDRASYMISFDNEFFKNKKKIEITSVKNKVTLRGSLIVKSDKIPRYYFWGEGQNYKNDVELFFSKGTVYVEQFFAKKNDDLIKLSIFKNFNIFEKKYKNTNHFNLMFDDIIKNFNKKSYKEFHRKNILNQAIFLSRSS